MTRTDQARNVLSDWKFWITLFGFGLAATVVALWFAFGRIAREEAFRAASMKAANVTQVGQCFTAAKNGPVTKGFIGAFETVTSNSITSTKAALAAQPVGPLTEVRLQSLVRLEAAKANTDALRRLINSSIPDKKKCVELAARLHVDASRYLQTKGTR